MLQRDYYLRIIEEFGKALANFLEKRYDGPRREHELRDLYRQYVGPYDVLCRLSTDETLDYAVREWPDSERDWPCWPSCSTLRPATARHPSARCSMSAPTGSTTT